MAMDSSAVQLPIDPVASAEVPRSADPSPGRKRDDRADAKDAAAAGLTASFADILRSKRLDVTAGREPGEKQGAATKARQAGEKGKAEGPAAANGRLAAAGRRIGQAVEVQAKETLEHARELAGQAMKASPGKTTAREGTEGLQAAAASKKGSLTPAEEALLKEMVRNNGGIAGQKKAARQTGYVNGEPLNRREGINAVKSMTAREGEVLRILTGAEGSQAPSKAKAARPPRPPQAVAASEPPPSEVRAAPAAPSAENVKSEFGGLAGGGPDRAADTGSLKRQAASRVNGLEGRDAPVGQAERSAPATGRAAGTPAARPQALMGQVLEGAAQILRDGSGRMVLNLQPPRLGTLDLDVVVQDNRVRMVMLADNQEVKQLLQAGMDDLRSALQDKGFEIDRLEVLVQNRPDGDGDGFRREAGFARGDSRGGNERKHGQDGGTPEPGIPVRPSRSGDGGLSVFA
ncbi:MAG TPA: flagellar hook-length control protein FliK [Syntrophales bacterium]|nr:flagellar hook-length control protein FliK [Syntrophales bacterium]